MTVDIFPILLFLTDKARGETLLPDAWTLIREVGAFAASSPSAKRPPPPDAETFADAVALFTRRKVDRVAVVPVACAMPNADYMSPSAYVSPFRAGVTVPGGQLDAADGKRLYDMVCETFADLLAVAIGARLAETPWANFAGAIADDMTDALYGYLAHVTAGDAVGALRYRYYVEHALRLHIVGEIADKPGVWVALAA